MNIGVIGCGQWGKNYVRVLHDMQDVRVTRVADHLERNRELLRERYPGLAVEEDHRTVLDDPAIDGVVIATPATTHFDIAAEALNGGKHVLVEKPLCLESRQ